MNGLHSPHHDPHQTTEREVKVRVNEVLGILSSLCISLALVMTSAYLLRMGVDATIPSLPISHLDKVIEDNYVEYDLSNFKFEWANLAHFILGVKVAEAAGYEAQVTELPGILTLKPGESGTLRVGFKNTGELRWRTPQTGTRYASIYTFDPKYHLSRLESKEWRRRDQPAVIESQTEADEIGYITIPVTAPFEPGLYEETFHLAIEDTAWVSGGKFSVSVRVSDEGVAVEVPKLESAPKNVPSPLRVE